MDHKLEDAESLFRINSVDQLKEIERKTRDQIEDKKSELRFLVGGKYREFLDSADTIILMGQTAQDVVSRFHRISSIISQKIERGSKNITPKAREEGEKYKQWHAAGALVKFIVDTREQMWMALESQHYTDSAVIYIVATSLCQQLSLPSNSQGKLVMTNFTFIPQQSKSIADFRGPILEAARARIYVPQLPTEDYADSLVCIALLEGWNLEKVIDEFYKLRTTSVNTVITTHPSSLSSSHSPRIECKVIDVLTKSIDIIRFTIYEASLLFSNTPWSSSTDSIFASSIHTVLHSQPYTFTKDGPTKRWAGNKNIANVIQTYRPKLSALPTQFSSCMQSRDFQRLGQGLVLWAENTLTVIAQAFPGLCSNIVRGSELAHVGACLLETLDAVIDTSFMSKSLVNPPSWKEICETVLGRHLIIWDEYLYTPFVTRAQDIMKSQFSKLTINSMILDYFQELESHPEVGSNMGNDVWRDFDAKQVVSDVDLTRQTQGCSPTLAKICTYIDSFLKSTIEDFQPLVNLDMESNRENSKKMNLMSYFQDAALDALLGLGTQLQSIVQELIAAHTEANTGGSDIVLQKVLFLGRLSRLIPVRCESITRIFNGVPGSTIKNLLQKKPLRRKVGLVGMEPSFARLSTTFRAVYLLAHEFWVSTLVQSVQSMLSNEFLRGGWLSFSKNRMWEEILLDESDPSDLGETAPLPTQASCFCTSLLHSICQIIMSAGAHTLDRAVVVYMKRTLSKSLLRQLLEYVSSLEENSVISNDAFVQMFFDIRYIFTVLHYPRPRVSLTQDQDRDFERVTVEEADEWSSQYMALMDLVKSKIDPVEFALFEHKLLDGVQRFYHRTTTFFGILTHTNTVKESKTVSTALSGASNVLQRASVAPRFSLLPITSASTHEAQAIDIGTSDRQTGHQAQGPSDVTQESTLVSKAYEDLRGQLPGVGLTSLFATAQKSTSTLFSTLTSAGTASSYVAQRWTTGK